MLSSDTVIELLAQHRVTDHPALPGRRNHLPAGVLVPIRWAPDPQIIVTLRTKKLRRHAGEICFPGGSPEAGDSDLWSTARREGEEELGLYNVRRLGQLSSMPVYTSDFRLFPFVVEVNDTVLRPQISEVAEVHHIPVDQILTQDHIEAFPWEWEGIKGLSPYFSVGKAQHIMFGATAHTFWELVQLLAPALHKPLPPLKPGRLTWHDVLPR